jgi:hypothetical protein
MFPFASLHPNDGSQLRRDILLLPKDSPACTSGDAQFDDHMHFLVVPIVANHGQMIALSKIYTPVKISVKMVKKRAT